jgi:polar amino acid transport system substrate-binding protein
MNTRDVLAPNGRLRAGVFPGSPLSMTLDRTSGEMHGLGFDLGRELAMRLGVRFEPVEFRRIAEVIEAMKTGNVRSQRNAHMQTSSPAISPSLTEPR